MAETVLIVGATGNIGVAAAHGALKSGRHVLAVVRNATSAQKLFDALGTKDRITTVEADITSETGLQTVVEQVKAGKLPAFQHVYACAGGYYEPDPLRGLTSQSLRNGLEVNFWRNFYAYHATIDYLQQQKSATSWTLCTGAQGEAGIFAGAAITQGALFSLVAAAAYENSYKNVRVNEQYLAFRVEIDSSAEKSGAMKASKFGDNYSALLERTDIRGARVIVTNEGEVTNLRFEKKGNYNLTR